MTSLLVTHFINRKRCNYWITISKWEDHRSKNKMKRINLFGNVKKTFIDLLFPFLATAYRISAFLQHLLHHFQTAFPTASHSYLLLSADHRLNLARFWKDQLLFLEYRRFALSFASLHPSPYFSSQVAWPVSASNCSFLS